MTELGLLRGSTAREDLRGVTRGKSLRLIGGADVRCGNHHQENVRWLSAGCVRRLTLREGLCAGPAVAAGGGPGAARPQEVGGEGEGGGVGVGVQVQEPGFQ